MTRYQLNSEFVVASVSMVHSAQADGQRVVSLPSHPSEEATGGLLRLGSLAFAICASTKQVPLLVFSPVRNDIRWETILSSRSRCRAIFARC
jgi:hypothetical protein